MIFWIADNGNSPTVAPNDIAFRNRVFCVIRTLGVYVRFKRQQKLCHGWLVEDCYKVDGLESGNDLGSLTLIHNRPSLAFQDSDLLIRIDTDHQKVAQRPRILEISDMTDVQDIKTTIGKYDPFAFFAAGGNAGE